MNRAPRAMVLAAGLGTRLAPLTDELPKPLVPVGDRPQIDHVLAWLSASGFSGVVVNTHHRAHAFAAAWQAAQPLSVLLSHEHEILGTAGGVAQAAALLGDGDVLVWNADVLMKPDLAGLERVARAGNDVATLLVSHPKPAGQGTVGLDAQGKICRLRSFERGGEERGADYTGLLWLGAALRARLPQRGCLVAEVLMPALERGQRVGSFLHPGGFLDTGSLSDYLGANQAFLAERGLKSFVHPNAQIGEGISLSSSVVGAGAVVRGRGTLTGCVVWPGAQAEAPLERAIVTPSGVVFVPSP